MKHPEMYLCVIAGEGGAVLMKEIRKFANLQICGFK
jgi:hypothetical protein